ncbi:unnamed protein product [Mycena citricolor]|uniref:Uncharacterized protein n=1 Tax=Mycena citricolor TaxID=2018698 RepID=A0AAD2HIY1_9AGAR|nr:unnamed protein product [Mycena citricolor]
MSASGQYLSADPSAFPTSEIDPYMNNPMIRQSTAPNMIGLNNAAFMQPQPPNPHGGPNPPMGMLPGGPDMRFPQGHAAMVPRNMAMRPGPSARPPGMNPAMGGMGGLQGNPQMPGGGMGFPAGMMPSGGMGGVRRVVSNPVGGMGGMPPSMMQQQHQQLQQHQQQQQQQHQHQQHQMHQQHMLRLQHQQQQQQRVEMMRSGMVPTPVRGTPMASLSQPPSLNQVQPSNMSANAFPNPGPPPPSSPRTHTPVMNLPTGQQQQQRAPAHMFDMEYSHNQFQQRPMMGNGQFPFPPSSTPPLNMNESFPPSGSTPGRAPGAFPPTPAQQLSMNHSNENYGFMSPRPPSQQQQTRAPQHSPQHHDLRPESQPPPSGPPTGRTLTPRPGRVPMQPSPAQGTPPSNSSAPAAIAPRPPAPGSSDGTMMTGSASPPEMAPGPPVPRMTANPLLYSIGYGQGVLRMMQFSGILGSINPQAQSQKMQVSYWDLVIREYFTPKAVMKLTLWRDSMKNEAKPFEIGVPILPRFFLVTTQSGVKSMSLTLDGARERVASPGHAIVECVAAEWTCRYTNGHVVTLRGPLKARLVMCSLSPTSATPFVLKFDDLEFDATSHDKYVLIDSILGRRPVPDQRRGDDPSPPAGGDEDRGEPRVPIETGSIQESL